MHLWGDDDVDWDGINAAADYIGLGLRKWGRVDVTQSKEKYGTVRVYCYLGIGSFHQLIWPGYCYNQFPWRWLWRLDLRIHFIWKLLSTPINAYHKWLYRGYYKKAVNKWPHLRKEILSAADYDELLRGL